MTSSNRRVANSDAALVCGDKRVGPMRLPRIGQREFISEFNETYARLGLSIAISALSQKKILGTDDDAEDD